MRGGMRPLKGFSDNVGTNAILCFVVQVLPGE